MNEYHFENSSGPNRKKDFSINSRIIKSIAVLITLLFIGASLLVILKVY